MELPWDEQRYAETHWSLLRQLRAASRTEPSVRLAVLFGSVATGEDGADSDIDLLVAFDRPGGLARSALPRAFAAWSAAPVHVVTLAQARARPSLLADVLDEGRVLIDRDDLWASLADERDEILRHAARDEAATASRANAAVEQARRRL